MKKIISNIKKIFLLISKKDIEQNFLQASVFNRYYNKNKALCIGFNPWKREWFGKFVPEYNLYFIKGKNNFLYILLLLKKIKQPYDIFIWGYTEHPLITKYLQSKNITYYRVEDGFIRSVGLGAEKIEPLSLAIDKFALYYDPASNSEIHKLIEYYSLNITDKERELSKKYINFIKENSIDKYNISNNHYPKSDFMQKIINEQRKKILVIGQVDDDMSIKKGAYNIKTSHELLKLAHQENQNCLIIYRIHPDIWNKKRKNNDDFLVDLADSENIVIMSPSISLNNIWDKIDTVYTITSLTGFEALLRNKKVICTGRPFYSGYGLTQDRYNADFKKQVDLEILFYAAYIKYPRYLTHFQYLLDSIVEKKIYNPILEQEKRFLEIKNDIEDDDGLQIGFFDTNRKFKSLGISSMQNLIPKENNEDIVFVTYISNNDELFTSLFSHGYSNLDIATKTIVTQNNIIDKYNNFGYRNIYSFHIKYRIASDNATILRNKIEKDITLNLQNLFISLTQNFLGYNLSYGLELALIENIKSKLNSSITEYITLLQFAKEYETIIFYVHDINDPIFNIIYDIIFDISFKAKIYFILDKNKVAHFNPSKEKKLKNNILNFIGFNKMIEEYSLYWKEINHYLKDYLKDIAKENIVSISGILPKKEMLINNNTEREIQVLELIEIISTKKNKILIIPPTLESCSVNEVYKKYFFSNCSNSNITVYDINAIERHSFIKNKLESIIHLDQQLYLLVSNRLNNTFSKNLVHLLEAPLLLSLSSFKKYLLFLSEMRSYQKNAKAYYVTAITNLTILNSFFLKQRNIPTVFINTIYQPTIKSEIINSFTHVGIMDDINAYQNRFFNNKLVKIGSANLTQKYKESLKHTIKKSEKFAILLILQHSVYDFFIELYHILVNICIKLDIDLVIKPHPSQDMPTLTYIQEHINKYNISNVTLYHKNSNLMEIASNVDLVIGSFSNALIEIICYFNKRLITVSSGVLCSSLVKETVDFEKVGLSINSELDKKYIYKLILDAIKDGDNFLELDKRRQQYLLNNNQLFQTDTRKNFILQVLE
ncbi:hypothetical protein AAID96_03380 [Campylobacter coli]